MKTDIQQIKITEAEAPSRRAGGHHDTTLKTSAFATFHCLTGCVIGEVAGLMIGVSAGFPTWGTITLAVALAFIVGFALAVFSLIRRENLTFKQAMRIIWIGEVVSITVMEIAMNAVDYWAGGVQAHSIFAPVFWYGLAAAIPAGYLCAWPANHFLLKKELKRCH